MASYLRCALQRTPNDLVGYIAAGGTNWGYVYAGWDGGEPLVFPPPEPRSKLGYYIQSSAHNSWFLNKGASNAATWTTRYLPVKFNFDQTISHYLYPDLKLCVPNYPAEGWISWVSKATDPNFDNKVLVFTWEER